MKIAFRVIFILNDFSITKNYRDQVKKKSLASCFIDEPNQAHFILNCIRPLQPIFPPK